MTFDAWIQGVAQSIPTVKSFNINIEELKIFPVRPKDESAGDVQEDPLSKRLFSGRWTSASSALQSQIIAKRDDTSKYVSFLYKDKSNKDETSQL